MLTLLLLQTSQAAIHLLNPWISQDLWSALAGLDCEWSLGYRLAKEGTEAAKRLAEDDEREAQERKKLKASIKDKLSKQVSRQSIRIH